MNCDHLCRLWLGGQTMKNLRTNLSSTKVNASRKLSITQQLALTCESGLARVFTTAKFEVTFLGNQTKTIWLIRAKQAVRRNEFILIYFCHWCASASARYEVACVNLVPGAC